MVAPQDMTDLVSMEHVLTRDETPGNLSGTNMTLRFPGLTVPNSDMTVYFHFRLFLDWF
jgi:hypothetical protein